MTASLLSLKGVSSDTVNPDDIEELIERVKTDEDFERKLVDALEREKQKEPREPIVYWIMLVLGYGESEKAIPELMRGLWDEREYVIGEIAQRVLPQIGEPAFREALDFLENGEPNSEQRIGLYFLIQNVAQLEDEKLRQDTVDCLKNLIQEELSSDAPKHLKEIAVKTLAVFGDSGDPEYVRQVLDKIPSSPETREAEKLLKGTVDHSDFSSIGTFWQEVARRIPDY